MQQEIQVRAAVPEDAKTLSEFVDGLIQWEASLEVHFPHTETVNADVVRQLLEEQTVSGLIASLDSVPVGAAVYHFYRLAAANGRSVMYLEDLWCEPDFRGIGVGKALMKRLCSEARKRNCVKIEWKCLSANSDAAAFYSGLGATEEADYRTFTWKASDFLV